MIVDALLRPRRSPVSADPTMPLDRLRRNGVIAWAVFGWASLALLLITDALLGAGAALGILLTGTVVNAAPTLMAMRGRFDAEARTLAGSIAAVIPALLVFLLRGHPWQMDGHMYFFVGMAGLVFLADWRPIALATIITAVHHISLEWIAPAWVFAGAGDLGRIAFHVVAVGCQFLALAIVTILLERLLMQQQEALSRSREAAEAAEAGRKELEQAMQLARFAEARASQERRDRDEETTRLARERRGELMTLANAFEESVTTFVRDIEDASGKLEAAAVQLDAVAGDANRDATEASISTTAAATGMGQVASSIGTFSSTIASIADAADSQSRLTQDASSEAKLSVQTVTMLEEHAVEIEGFLADIRTIATRTNLLALNATIEAARAGEAGRGFAVVANEVKSLSAESARASDRIGALVSNIREGVVNTGDKLRSVSAAIGEVSAAASEIARTVGNQRNAAVEVDRGASSAAEMADDIRNRIDNVAKAVTTTSSLSGVVKSGAQALTVSSRNLRSSTDLFVTFLRSDEPPGIPSS